MITNIFNFKKLYEASNDKDKIMSFLDWHKLILDKIKNEGVNYEPIISFIEKNINKQVASNFFKDLNYDDVISFYGDGSDNDIRPLISKKDELEAIINGFLDGINEQTIVTPSKPKFDLNDSSKSLTANVLPLISTMNNKSFDEIKSEFKNILNNKEVHASDKTVQKWMDIINTSPNKNRLMTSITNLYLKGSNLGVSESYTGDELLPMDELKTLLLNIQGQVGNVFMLHEIKDNDGPYGVVEIQDKMYKVWGIKDNLLWIENYPIDNASDMEMQAGYLGTPDDIASMLLIKTQQN